LLPLPHPLVFVQRRARSPLPPLYPDATSPSPAQIVLNLWRRRTTKQPSLSARFACPSDCPLAACPIGYCALVIGISCPAQEARRLRTLGVFEGARVNIIDTRSGILLDVRGSRLALDVTVAGAILVRPIAA